jgi:hypothetical protein
MMGALGSAALRSGNEVIESQLFALSVLLVWAMMTDGSDVDG